MAHECDDWHDGNCSECCKQSSCPACKVIGGVISRELEGRRCIGYKATVIYEDGHMFDTWHETWDQAHKHLAIDPNA